MITNKSGVYKITNTINGHKYIGSAVNINKRWNLHRSHLNNGKHRSAHLQNAWNKYGAGAFEFKVLEYCEKDKLIVREQFYIDSEKPAYNICPIAGSSLGVKRSEETKRKLSEAGMGHVVSEKTRKKLSEAGMGRHPSDETRRKLSETGKGHPVSDEARRKLSAAAKGHPAWNKGLPTPEEIRAKISESKSGEKHPLYGKHLSDETRAKISATMIAYRAKQKESLSYGNEGENN